MGIRETVVSGVSSKVSHVRSSVTLKLLRLHRYRVIVILLIVFILTES